MQVKYAMSGDVVLDSQGQVWKRGENYYDWSNLNGPVVYYGKWKDAYGPQGELFLLVRDGTPVHVDFPGKENQ